MLRCADGRRDIPTFTANVRNPPMEMRIKYMPKVPIVLVLSEAVLVLVIDVRIVLHTRIGDTIEFHCLPSHHREDPTQHRFHRSIILPLAASPSSPTRPGSRHTPEQNQARDDVDRPAIVKARTSEQRRRPKDDNRRVVRRRRIAQSSRLDSITSTSTVATRLSTSTRTSPERWRLPSRRSDLSIVKTHRSEA